MRALRFVLGLALSCSTVSAQETAEDNKIGRRVQDLLRAHQAAVFRCVSAQTEPVEGEALLRVAVGRGGQATQVELLKSDSGARAAAECVARSAQSWDYAPLRAAEGDQVVFPLRFQPEVERGEPARGAAVAVAARIGRHVIARKGTLALHTTHTSALFVASGGAVSLSSEGRVSTLAVGDVALLGPQTAITLSAPVLTKLLFIESATDVGDAQPGAVMPRPRSAVSPQKIMNGAAEVGLYLDGLAAPFAVDRLCAKKGTTVPKHEHTSDELLYIESGKGTTTLGAQTLVVKADESLTIPRGTTHSLRVDADLCAVQVYAPAGPEQRFKQTPERKVP